jgi:hypothetical protein
MTKGPRDWCATMSTLYCKIYVDAECDGMGLLSRLQTIFGGSIERRTLRSTGFELDVSENESSIQARAEAIASSTLDSSSTSKQPRPHRDHSSWRAWLDCFIRSGSSTFQRLRPVTSRMSFPSEDRDRQVSPGGC